MQVADNTQTASSATIGAQATRKVSMVEDASFFMMLSSNLYSNQKLAFIREVLCNAWDAHIEAGTTDQPVMVSIDANHDLIIKDSGKGISDDLIDQIYGTYGGSTKREDKATTGGFGLGSKSPWAYVESFRVASEFDGKKTVYNMARTCIENDGKPGITPVMTVPTDRTGLTVTIRLEEHDLDEIVEYIQAISLHGDMRVQFCCVPQNLNHFVPLRQLGMSSEPGSYNLDSARWHFSYMGNHKVFIRYGAVIYPALRTPATEPALKVIETFMETVGYTRIVVQAAPSTLALTPSREALSSQKMTEDGITDICVDLVDQIEKEILAKLPETMEQLKNYTRRYNYEGMFGKKIDFWQNIQNPVVQRYVRSKLGKDVRTKYYPALWDILKVGFKLYAKANFSREVARFLIQQHWLILNSKRGKSLRYESRVVEAAAQKYIVKPKAKLICDSNGLIKGRDLLMVKNTHWNNMVIKTRWYDEYESIKDLRNGIENKRIFVTTRIKDLPKSVANCPQTPVSDMREWAVRVNKASDVDAVIAYLTDAGYEVIDLTKVNKWDSVAVSLDLERKAKAKAKAEGKEPEKKESVNMLVSLKSLYDDKGEKQVRGSEVSDLLKDDVEFITETPLFFMENNEAKSNGQLGDFTFYPWLSDDERLHGVVVRNGIERNMAVKRGAVHVDEYFRQRFMDVVLSPEYKKYMTKQRQRAVSDDHYIHSVDLKLLRLLGVTLPGYGKLFHNPKFEKHFELLDSYSPKAAHARGEISAELCDKLTDEVKKYKLEQLPFIRKVKAMKTDDLLRQIGSPERIIKYMKAMPERKAALKSLVLSALKTGN